jgi:hypothetical protein
MSISTVLPLRYLSTCTVLPLRYLSASRLISLLLCTCLFALPAYAEMFRVGVPFEPGCTHSSLSSAVAAANANADTSNSIRISNSQTYTDTRIIIANAKALSMEGGFDSCIDTTSDPAQPAVLNALSGLSMFTVQLSGTGAVTLSNLIVRGGSADTGGGISLLSGDLILDNVQIRNNEARLGAGIYVAGTSAAPARLQIGTTARPSFIFENTALPLPGSNGGGIYGTGASTVNVVLGDFSANSAGTGAGIYLTNGAQLNFTNPNSSTSIIRNNAATLNGGGIFADAGAQVVNANAQLLIDGNSGRAGAAIWAGGGADVDLRYPFIKGTTAAATQSSVVSASGTGTTLTLRGGPRHVVCATEFCSQVRGINSAMDALDVRAGAVMELERMHITGFNGSIAPIYVLGGELILSSSLVSGNQNSVALLQPSSSGTIRMRYSTVTGNTAPAMFTNPGVASNVELQASIVHNSGLLAAAGNTITFTNGLCRALVNENSNADGVGRTAPGSGLDANFIPTPQGSATDSCAADPVYTTDMQSNSRPVDYPLANLLGPQDLGAFELQPEPPLFRNGFE